MCTLWLQKKYTSYLFVESTLTYCEHGLFSCGLAYDIRTLNKTSKVGDGNISKTIRLRKTKSMRDYLK